MNYHMFSHQMLMEARQLQVLLVFFSLGLSYLIRIFIIKFRKIKMIEQIYNQKKLYALIVRNSYRKKKELAFLPTTRHPSKSVL